jgi:hypothetical protein
VGDIFLFPPGGLHGPNENKVICMLHGGEIGWHDAFGDWWPANSVHVHAKIGSLSGVARIVNGLSQEPAYNSLSYLAMKRQEVVEAGDVDEIIDLLSSSLNDSHSQVVNTVLSDAFRVGFLAVQGPPGTGKTTTSKCDISE